MASSKRGKIISKRFSKVTEEPRDIDDGELSKSKQRKPKWSDMLGPQWSKGELVLFYEAFRKYGKDWKKVANAVRNRSTDMVKALYNMNKSYLSLPEGAASVAGLIAMMTDHYNMLEGSGSDNESNDGSGTSKKPQKRPRKKFQINDTKDVDKGPPDLLQRHPIASTYGCSALLKKRRSGGSRPRIVGKRTPRIPVMDDGKRRGIANRPNISSEGDHDEDEVAQAVLALAEASQRGGSPQVSQTPSRRTEQTPSPPAQNDEKKFVLDEGCAEGSLESREAENMDSAKAVNRRALRDTGSTGVLPVQHKVKMQEIKKKLHEPETAPYDDVREECSCTEDGLNLEGDKGEHEAEVSHRKSGKPSPKKRRTQMFTTDETSALDALQTLADLSLNCIFQSVVESESSVQVKEEKGNVDIVDKPTRHEVVSLSFQKERSRSSSNKEKGVSSTRVAEEMLPKNSKLTKSPSPGVSPVPFAKQLGKSAKMASKTKRKSLTGKTTEFLLDVEAANSEKTENQEGKRGNAKSKRVSQGSPSAKQVKPVKTLERTSSSTDLGRIAAEKSVPTEQVSLPTKHISRRKMSLPKAAVSKETPLPDTCGNTSHADHGVVNWKPDKNSSLIYNKVANLKDQLAHCISSTKLRRWCTYEWFYSAMDYPWFARSEFVEYLNHVGLGHIPRLTRVEWGVIRSSLGKPRRLSQQFLCEEREKLEQYRDSVRRHYAEVRTGVCEMATDLARPLTVGQCVIACHPRTREIHDGSILTVDRNRCRVQFDRHELGVEFVLDIDCMPLNPFDNISETLRRKGGGVDGVRELMTGSTSELLEHTLDRPVPVVPNHSMETLLKQAKAENIDAIIQAKAAANEVSLAAQQAMYNQPCTLAQIQATEADIRALTDLTRALDKKEALLIELKHMNEEVGGNQNNEAIRDSDHFRKQYAMVLLQLRDVNEQVASALRYLRQRNTYHDGTNILCKSVNNVGVTPNSVNSDQPCNTQESAGPHVLEIIDTARKKARVMVEAAMQAMSSLKDGEDAFLRVGESLEYVENNNRSGNETGVTDARILNPGSDGLQSSVFHHTQTGAVASGVTMTKATDPGRDNSSDCTEAQVLSELISSCVATLLMIQTCTERQYPPAEVAQILDTAVTNLQPCCSENLVAYREIQQCMGIVKNQILALIPTQPGVQLSTELPTM